MSCAWVLACMLAAVHVTYAWLALSGYAHYVHCMYGFMIWSLSKAQPRSKLEAGLVPAIRTQGFPLLYCLG